MIEFASLLVLAFAVSLDSFGVGMTYGLRKVHLPLRSIVIIALCSFTMIFVATGVAQGILYFLSPHGTEKMGGIILIGLGLWALYNVSNSKDHGHIPVAVNEHPQDKMIWSLELKKIGIAIQVLQRPMVADMDRSGVISGAEALILGFALALDAFGAGIGAALMGYAPWLTAVSIGVMSSLFVFLGIKCGALFAELKWMNRLIYLPAVILISFGLIKLL
ncbi:sporulation membrane protein YtaF [Caldalkalibacillus thermarum TA2.A1]|uniref:Sporulation membrane protein YtaF n=1 Tax=Caldalkalibacillus thermarum (strain TA2.A1) TaxID=986075 RepID=A0A8X8LBG9_CALTT|nr:sporulation membrane protein YtaF [Caldalkalibacillus thermarum]QZT34953.1 sporulation membrane protein YtaF [Caldalkalibacillus thermarum TA2.A1]